MSIGKKSFENMGRFIGVTGKTIASFLQPSDVTWGFAQAIVKQLFANKKILYLCIDDTLIKKIFALSMQGSGFFFDTKIGRRIMAYRIVVAVFTDGKYIIPIDCCYFFAKELVEKMLNKPASKDDIAETLVLTGLKLFPKKQIIVVADGLYATVRFMKWCIENKIALEVRMHSNRKVFYNGRKMALREIIEQRGMRPKGRQMARTISVVWHDLPLEITIVRRIDKHGEETIVFQAATYKTLPRKHVRNYGMRWGIEKAFRTTKQHLGLQECFSTSFVTQSNHVAAVFLAYTLSQVEMKNNADKTPEVAIKRLKMRKVHFQINRFANRLQDLSQLHG